MNGKIRKKTLAILGILRSGEGPFSSSEITRALSSLGYEISERTVRFYLQQMDREGLAETIGKRGHRITPLGLREIQTSGTLERVGLLSAKIDRMTYAMNFDLTTRTGTVVVNLTFVPPDALAERAEMICRVYAEGYAMGHLLALLGPGERLGSFAVPEGMVGIATVCSVTLNGVLLKRGIPTNSRFGGLLELRQKLPTRFVEIITYEGTSIDPLKVFIRSGMTDYVGAIRSGDGRIGASFREFPAESRDLLAELAHRLERIGLGGFMRIGRPSQPLLEIPVSEGRVGAVVIGGLNPVAIFEETGLRVQSHVMAGIMDFNRLFRIRGAPFSSQILRLNPQECSTALKGVRDS